MLDMGFLPDIRRILSELPEQRQTLLFSATMPRAIVDLTREILRDPVTIEVARKPAPAHGVNHSVYLVAQEAKAPLFIELLARNEMRSVLAFTRTKHRANRLERVLTQHRVSAAVIHGNRTQAQRTRALEGFKAGHFRVLVATDIAARGIDIDELSHVVNFDVPHVAEDYIHRVGRTARKQATGDALTFVSREEEHGLRSIERAIGRPLPRVTLAGFDYEKRPAEALEVPLATRLAAMRQSRAGGRGGRRPVPAAKRSRGSARQLG
jgi:ATP-dependent RNA helicase RhlE